MIKVIYSYFFYSYLKCYDQSMFFLICYISPKGFKKNIGNDFCFNKDAPFVINISMTPSLIKGGWTV